jgi:hypothetical protein
LDAVGGDVGYSYDGTTGLASHGCDEEAYCASLEEMLVEYGGSEVNREKRD